MYAIINVSLKSVFRKYYCDIDSFLHYVIHSICFAASNRNIEEIHFFNVNIRQLCLQVPLLLSTNT